MNQIDAASNRKTILFCALLLAPTVVLLTTIQAERRLVCTSDLCDLILPLDAVVLALAAIAAFSMHRPCAFQLPHYLALFVAFCALIMTIDLWLMAPFPPPPDPSALVAGAPDPVVWNLAARIVMLMGLLAFAPLAVGEATEDIQSDDA